MSNNFLNQPKTKYSEKRFYTLSECVKHHMNKNNIKQSDLVERSGLTKTTISRICRNSNDKGYAYSTRDITIIMALSIALKLTPTEKDEMLLVAFPETEFWNEFLIRKLNLMECNDILDDNGFTPLGNIKEE